RKSACSPDLTRGDAGAGEKEPPAPANHFQDYARGKMSQALVTIEDVDMRYGGPEGLLAVEGLSLQVAKGEFAAVVGPSGCGKSTLMKLVTGLYIPQEGNVLVAGERVTKPVNIVGMAFQN